VMLPRDAFFGPVEVIPCEEAPGRIAAEMATPYPPGIPTIMPGERFGAPDEPIIQSLRIAREQNGRFPGFESDVHGLIIDRDGDVPSYKVEVLKT